MSQDRFQQIKIGDEAEIVHTITVADVDSFVKLTGDDNPLHVDDAYAARTTFRKRVVHGMLTASFISAMIGTKLPGRGSVWYEQHTRFLAPVRIGERIRVWARVKHKNNSQRIIVLKIAVFGEGNRRVIEGEAKVRVLKLEEKKEMSSSEKKKGAVIVTGASGGIGSATARALAHEGYPIIVNYMDRQDKAESVTDQIIAEKGKAIPCKADVTDENAVQKMVDLALKEFQTLSGVVNNASALIDAKDFLSLSWDDVQTHVDIQIKGALFLTQSVLPHLLALQRGVIVNITSIFAEDVPPIKLVHYNLAKGALVSFSRSLAVEYGPKGIRVNSVSPGMTMTDMISNVPEKAKMVTRMQTPLRRLAFPEDIAGAVAFLFSDKASFITGQNIRVCGGIVMG